MNLIVWRLQFSNQCFNYIFNQVICCLRQWIEDIIIISVCVLLQYSQAYYRYAKLLSSQIKNKKTALGSKEFTCNWAVKIIFVLGTLFKGLTLGMTI